MLQHDEQAVLYAVEQALEDGVATKTHVLNIDCRSRDPANMRLVMLKKRGTA